jgi:hypothetical protein
MFPVKLYRFSISLAAADLLESRALSMDVSPSGQVVLYRDTFARFPG